ncbi:MAG: hypothetical protein IJX99_08760 [Clostridia bacterium]|nr:hypothetical protein [Clostridia bacterium]
MELTVLNDVKNIDNEKNLTNDIELNKINENMNELSGQLEEYLKNNEVDNIRSEDLKRPVDIDITTEKNEFGDTTILGKITIEKSAAKDLERIQNKVEKAKNDTVSLIQKGLLKVYDGVKDTFIGNIAEKILDVGGKILKSSSKVVLNATRKILNTITK